MTWSGIEPWSPGTLVRLFYNSGGVEKPIWYNLQIKKYYTNWNLGKKLLKKPKSIDTELSKWSILVKPG